MRPFHYAFKIKDIKSTREFYIDILGCKEGRSTENWIDFDFYGHQLSAHISDNIPDLDYCGKVDGVNVPIPHFGAIVTMDQFRLLHKNLESKDIHFLLKPRVRYEGLAGEQWTMFFLDFSNNPIEIKAFKNEDGIFK